MTYHPLASVSIRRYGYDPRTRIMEVEMKGGTYFYHGVDPAHHEGMLRAPSAGAYFNEHIKPAHHATKG